MILYHMSDTLPLNTPMKPDFPGNMPLVQPFLQALERSEDCFFATLMAAKHQKAVLRKFGFQDMQTNYTKWATEAIFEFVRRRSFADKPCRMLGHYFFDDLADIRTLCAIDWAGETEENRAKIHLYEVELADERPARLDMRLFDAAFDAMWEREDIPMAFQCAERYFAGEASEAPVWELLSEGQAVAVRDVSELLREKI